MLKGSTNQCAAAVVDDNKETRVAGKERHSDDNDDRNDNGEDGDDDADDDDDHNNDTTDHQPTQQPDTVSDKHVLVE